VVRFADPDGMLIELIESTPGGAVVPWTASPVPAEHMIRGFYTETFGYRLRQDILNN
jgi:hypothetical protein